MPPGSPWPRGDAVKKQVIEHKSKAKYWPRAVVAGDQIYVATSGIGEDGQAVGPTFEEQFDFTLNEVKETLESLGSSIDDIVEMTIYFLDMKEDNDKVGPIWAKYFKVMPMVAGIGTSQLLPMDPPLRVEVTLTAIIPS